MLKKIVMGALVALSLVLPAAAAERAIIVLDGSGSMWAQVDGKARITIARETLKSVLAEVPDTLELGFMTYGHREKGNCGDIEMLVEPAAGTASAIAEAAEGISPKGMTPLSDAVRLAAEDLRYTEEKATVILITDGLETCEVDPCQLGSDLESQGIDFTAHVLGFGLSDDEGRQVACLAENTGGKYLSAQDGDDLVDALTTTVAEVVQAEPEPAPEPEPAKPEFNFAPTAALAEGDADIKKGEFDIVWSWNRVAADGTAGEWVGTDYHPGFKGNLEPGDYIMTAEIGYARVSQPVTIVAGETAEPHFIVNGTVLKLRPRPSEGGAVDSNASVEIRNGSEYVTTFYGEVNTVAPAGALTAIVKLGEAEVTREWQAKAGDTIDEDIVVSVGVAKIVSKYVPGMAVNTDIFVEIFEVKKAIDGTRKSLAYGYGGEQQFTLPPGDYVAAYRLKGTKGEVPLTVVAEELVETTINLEAGIVAVAVPGDNYVELLGAAKTIEGKRESFDYGYGPNFETTLKAGDYVIFTRIGDVEKETPVTVKAGERVEITIAP